MTGTGVAGNKATNITKGDKGLTVAFKISAQGMDYTALLTLAADGNKAKVVMNISEMADYAAHEATKGA